MLLLVGTSNAKSVFINESYLTGLTFWSHEVNRDERTSLNLTPDKALRLSKGFILEFDLKLRQEFHTYGYVFRAIVNDTASLDMTSYMGEGRISFILNNTRKAKAVSEYKFSKEKFRDKWVKVIIEVDSESIKYTIDGKKTIINKSFENLKTVKILFGANRHEFFYSSDVPPMSIRRIVIRNEKNETIRNWSMAEHGDDIVYDNVREYPATISSGVWEVDKHTEWKKEGSLTIEKKGSQIASDSINGRVFVATTDSLYIIDVKDWLVKRVKVKSGEPFSGAPSQLIYNYKNNELISYSSGQDEFMTFNFNTNSWSNVPNKRDLRRQHHSRLIIPESNQLVMFGGYGFYKYNAILATHELSSNANWTSVDFIDEITPRYLASMGYLGNSKMLLFGGYGSSTGQQEESSRNLYDVFEVDIENKKSRKLGEFPQFHDHYTFGNSMVVETKQHKFHTLGYQNDRYRTSAQLFEMDYKDFKYRTVANPIPYNFQDTESFCDLFRLGISNQLCAVILQRETSTTFTISVYTLMYPPLAVSDVIQNVDESKLMDTSGKFVLWLLLILFLLALIFIYFYGRKVKKKNTVRNKAVTDGDVLILDSLALSKSSSIVLLGGFQVFDVNGEDITGDFTPIIRQMFLACLLETLTVGKGLTSKRLEEMFWSDMDKSSATNNRNVNIRKLRLVLKKTSGTSMRIDNSYWQIDIGNDVFCDYSEIMELLKDSKKNKSLEKSLVERVISLALAGVLLPNIDEEWVDKYKSEYSDLLVNFLLRASNEADVKEDLKLMVKLSNAIFLYDSIDEDAIKIKCWSLSQLGQKGLSKQSYDKFYEEYLHILNEPPKLTYEDIISS